MVRSLIGTVIVFVLFAGSAYAGMPRGLECRSDKGFDLTIQFQNGDERLGTAFLTFDFPVWTGGDDTVAAPYSFVWSNFLENSGLDTNIWKFDVSTSLMLVVEKDEKATRQAVLYDVKTYSDGSFEVEGINDQYSCE
jgi:hypothetical protein